METILQRARESFPGVTPRIISDNGPQFIAKDFKEFIRIAGMTHVKTSPYYPQSNGKIERWHKTLKGECIRVQVPLSLDDARRIVADYVTHYNNVRLHSAIGYVTPKDKLDGRDAADHRRTRPQAGRGPRTPQASNARPSTTGRSVSPLSAARPAIDFAAVRAAITIAAVLQLLGFTPQHRPRRPATRPLSVARLHRRHQPLLLRQPGRSTPSTASSAAAPATPWTCGPRPPASRIYDAAIDLCQRLGIPLPTLPPMPHRNREEEPVALEPRTTVQCRQPERVVRHPLPANSTRRFFQIRLNQDSFWPRA